MKTYIVLLCCVLLICNTTFSPAFANVDVKATQPSVNPEKPESAKNEILDRLIDTLNKLEEMDDKEIMAELNKSLLLIEKLKDDGLLSEEDSLTLRKNLESALKSPERKEIVKTTLTETINNVQILSGDLIKVFVIGTVLSLGSIALLSQCLRTKGNICGFYTAFTLGIFLGFGFGIGIMK